MLLSRKSLLYVFPSSFWVFLFVFLKQNFESIVFIFPVAVNLLIVPSIRLADLDAWQSITNRLSSFTAGALLLDMLPIWWWASRRLTGNSLSDYAGQRQLNLSVFFTLHNQFTTFRNSVVQPLNINIIVQYEMFHNNIQQLAADIGSVPAAATKQ